MQYWSLHEQTAGRFRPRMRGGLGQGWLYLQRQHGSHMILRRDNQFSQVVVADHEELDRGTLRAIIRQADPSVDEFVQLLTQ